MTITTGLSPTWVKGSTLQYTCVNQSLAAGHGKEGELRLVKSNSLISAWVSGSCEPSAANIHCSQGLDVPEKGQDSNTVHNTNRLRAILHVDLYQQQVTDPE